MSLLKSIWAILTHNGARSDIETAIILILSVICTILFMWHGIKKSNDKQRKNMIESLGHEEYLRFKKENPGTP
ncbi:hypothetical protein KAI65_01305 [Candidatus Parcubacteria bacterium]|nr:hypothetical protein [Candidatus Parcubacteria bacterium]